MTLAAAGLVCPKPHTLALQQYKLIVANIMVMVKERSTASHLKGFILTLNFDLQNASGQSVTLSLLAVTGRYQ